MTSHAAALAPSPLQAVLASLWASAFVQSVLVFALAFGLGLAIGFERQWRQRTAGLRTNVLVAVGAAAFADLGMRLYGPEGGTRISVHVEIPVAGS